MTSRKFNSIVGISALVFALLGLFFALGGGAFAGPDDGTKTTDSSQGLTFPHLGF